jgi:excisionase family DNA binding protein
MRQPSDGLEARRHEMHALREAGLTYKGIGQKLGLSGERVRQVVSSDQKGPRADLQTARQPLLLRTAEVARLLGIHANTVRRWANDGSLRSYRVGKRSDRRFRRDDVERALSAHMALETGPGTGPRSLPDDQSRMVGRPKNGGDGQETA